MARLRSAAEGDYQRGYADGYADALRNDFWEYPDEYYINSIYGIGYNAGVDAARALPPVERYGGFRLRAAIAARGYSLDLTAAGSDGSGDWKLAMRLSDVFRWDASGTTEVTPSDFPPETAPPAGVPVTDSL